MTGLRQLLPGASLLLLSSLWLLGCCQKSPTTDAHSSQKAPSVLTPEAGLLTARETPKADTDEDDDGEGQDLGANPPHKIRNFAEAKRTLLKIYAEGGQDRAIYCGCRFRDGRIDLSSCGYVPHDRTRGERLEWEHAVPAEAFGQSFAEWREGHPKCVDSKGKAYRGRKCAQRQAPLFRAMEADMHNLFPSEGELNGLRSNYSMAMIPGEKRDFGSCNMEIEDGKVEPPNNVQGDIARAYLYMEGKYPGHGIISEKNRPLFKAWNEQDPPDAWERRRNELIEKAQGNRNPYIR